jgi:hypothetical protein
MAGLMLLVAAKAQTTFAQLPPSVVPYASYESGVIPLENLRWLVLT